MNENVACRLRVEPTWPLVEAARILGTSALLLVGNLERVRHSAARTARLKTGRSDAEYCRSEDELDLLYWTSIGRGM